MSAVVAHVPTLEPGETLSSLLLRLARNHAATPHELCTLLWPQFQVWTRDIDRTASDSLLAEISCATGLSRDALERATLRGLVRAMGFQARRFGCQDGILPLGIFHRVRRRFGQQFCPVCLASSPRYLRSIWRLEFTVVCPDHGVLLRDACPHCDAPFIPHRNQSLVAARCYRCGRSLVSGRRKRAPAIGTMLQRQIGEALGLSAGKVVANSAAAPGTCSWAEVEPAALLDGVRRLCRVAASKARGAVKGKAEAWAWMRVSERAAVMGKVWRWLAKWPDAWIKWATVAGLTAHDLESNYGPWPEWVGAALARLPYSHGPTQVRRRRQSLSFRQLRRHSANLAGYREARARILVRKARLAT